MNLLSIETLKNEFSLPVGVSGNIATVSVVSIEASVFEKHVTFDRTFKGQDD